MSTENKVTVITKANNVAVITRESMKNSSLVNAKLGIYQRVKDGNAIEPNGSNMPFFVIVQSKAMLNTSGIPNVHTVSAIVRFKQVDDAEFFLEDFEYQSKTCRIHTEESNTAFYEGQSPVQYIDKEGVIVIPERNGMPFYRQTLFASTSYSPKTVNSQSNSQEAEYETLEATKEALKAAM